MSDSDNFRNLVEASIQGILVQRDFHALFANARALDMIGLASFDELRRMSLLEIVPDDDREANLASYEALMRGEQVKNPTEARLVRRDGSVIWIERVITRVQWEGQPALMGTAIDITERKRSERERAEAFAEIVRLKDALQVERDYLREEVSSVLGGEMLGESDAVREMLERIAAVAETDASVLVFGESGVGKELIAREIHRLSPRAAGPMVKVNCASVPRELFESEFFGHVKGAFTGAHKNRPGRFQLADGGTLFLDEVGEIPLELQSKLLRVLQEAEFERVGDTATIKVDVRIVAATNRDLAEEVRAGRFREDLYYRLGVFPVVAPPLRQRSGDVPILARHFLDRCCAKYGRRGLALDSKQIAQLEAHDWPGNIRELQNVIERAVILARDAPLRLDPAPTSRETPAAGRRGDGRLDTTHAGSGLLTVAELKQQEKANFERALELAGGRIAGSGGAAELLGISPSTLRDRLKALGIVRDR